MGMSVALRTHLWASRIGPARNTAITAVLHCRLCRNTQQGLAKALPRAGVAIEPAGPRKGDGPKGGENAGRVDRVDGVRGGMGVGGAAAVGRRAGADPDPDLALVAAGWRGSRSIRSGGRRVGKVVALWSTIEVVALLVAANAVQYLDRGDLLFPAAAIIVGLHFFPLARGIPVRLYYATGAGFLAAGLGGLLVPAAQRPMAVGASAALVLWATALVVVLHVRSPVPA